jgi:hypothetical protein
MLPVESVIIASLLHDVCKSNIYKDAILNRKNDQGYWEKVPGYEVDYSSLPLGHGEKYHGDSCFMAIPISRGEGKPSGG